MEELAKLTDRVTMNRWRTRFAYGIRARSIRHSSDLADGSKQQIGEQSDCSPLAENSPIKSAVTTPDMRLLVSTRLEKMSKEQQMHILKNIQSLGPNSLDVRVATGLIITASLKYNNSGPIIYQIYSRIRHADIFYDFKRILMVTDRVGDSHKFVATFLSIFLDFQLAGHDVPPINIIDLMMFWNKRHKMEVQLGREINPIKVNYLFETVAKLLANYKWMNLINSRTLNLSIFYDLFKKYPMLIDQVVSNFMDKVYQRIAAANIEKPNSGPLLGVTSIVILVGGARTHEFNIFRESVEKTFIRLFGIKFCDPFEEKVMFDLSRRQRVKGFKKYNHHELYKHMPEFVSFLYQQQVQRYPLVVLVDQKDVLAYFNKRLREERRAHQGDMPNDESIMNQTEAVLPAGLSKEIFDMLLERTRVNDEVEFKVSVKSMADKLYRQKKSFYSHSTEQIWRPGGTKDSNLNLNRR